MASENSRNTVSDEHRDVNSGKTRVSKVISGDLTSTSANSELSVAAECGISPKSIETSKKSDDNGASYARSSNTVVASIETPTRPAAHQDTEKNFARSPGSKISRSSVLSGGARRHDGAVSEAPLPPRVPSQQTFAVLPDRAGAPDFFAVADRTLVPSPEANGNDDVNFVFIAEDA